MGGGVGILIHNTLTHKERSDTELPNPSDLESIFVEIKTRKGTLIIGSMYRPPHTKEKQFLIDYASLLKQLKREMKKIYSLVWITIWMYSRCQNTNTHKVFLI